MEHLYLLYQIILEIFYQTIKLKKNKKIENDIYGNFKSINYNEKWFCNNLNYLTVNFNTVKNVKKYLKSVLTKEEVQFFF